MEIIKAKDFNSRKALDESVLSTHGRTTEEKDAEIRGTISELEKLNLSHGQNVWGVRATATNYKVNNNPKVMRGKKTRSKINGQNI